MYRTFHGPQGNARPTVAYPSESSFGASIFWGLRRPLTRPSRASLPFSPKNGLADLWPLTVNGFQFTIHRSQFGIVFLTECFFVPRPSPAICPAICGTVVPRLSYLLALSDNTLPITRHGFYLVAFPWFATAAIASLTLSGSPR